MTEKVILTFNKMEIGDLVAEKYGLDKTFVNVTLVVKAGNQREPGYSKVVVEGKRKNQNEQR